MSDEVLYASDNRVATVTINRALRRNALTPSAIAALLDCLARAEGDPEVRAVCLTGAGDRVFCAGADLDSAMRADRSKGLPGSKEFALLLKRLVQFPKPLVARVNGHCLGGGLGIMLACDIVIAPEDASFFTPETGVGIFPMMVGALLYRNVGRKKAVDMVLTGRKVCAGEAERIGLITQAVGRGALDEIVGGKLAQLVSKGPLGITMGKKAFHKMDDMHFDDAVDFLCGELDRVVQTDDAAEGMAAFVEKRAPVFNDG